MTGGVAEARCQCGKVCKNIRGLKIHQSRSRCQSRPNQRERSANAGQTLEDHSQDSHHSTEDLLPTGRDQEGGIQEPEAQAQQKPPLEQGRVKWPPSNSGAWQELDSDLDKILASTLKGDALHKVSAMTMLIHTVASERFGTTQKKPRRDQVKLEHNRREKKIKELRKEIRLLGRRYKKGSQEEKLGLQH